MKKIYILLSLLCINICLYAQNLNDSYLKYIEQYRSIAIRQMQKEGIPASIIMAQALLESSAGNSFLAVKANNHFGIKCTSDWNGPSIRKDDDKRNECFRKYSKVEDSFTDHSAFLKRDRYASLYKIPSTDYKNWARGLKAAGYATDSQYAEKLIRLIENYSLHTLDTGERGGRKHPFWHIRIRSCQLFGNTVSQKQRYPVRDNGQGRYFGKNSQNT
ncbi:MAG: glucosaminidase domain-containing protein [Flavobacteriales bacterium]|nr:glucosaminidase domain-containing protein [Flavobacteriales bacterium]